MNKGLEQKIYSLNIKTTVVIFILITDLFSFLFDSQSNLNFSSFSDFDRLIFYGLMLCLFFDSFLWGEKEFLSIQVAKLLCTVISGKYQYSFFSAIFFYSLSFYYYNTNWFSSKKDKFFFLIENLFLCGILTFLCLRKDFLISIIVLCENLIFIYPILLICLFFPEVILKEYPESSFDFFIQETNKAPITLLSLFFPYCLITWIFLCSFTLSIIFICFILFSIFIELLSFYQHFHFISFKIFEYSILKIGIILLLLITGDQSGLIEFF